MPKSEIIVPGPHFINRDDFQALDIDLIGFKASGLGQISPLWTPPFVILTVHLHRKWKQGATPRKKGERSLLTASEQQTLGTWITKLANGQLLKIRSSGAQEDLRARGAYESKICKPSVSAVIKTAIEIWEACDNDKEGESAEKTRLPPMALIIQLCIKPLAIGHLSNERRVSQKVTSWISEEEDPDQSKENVITYFSVDRNAGEGWPEALVTSRANIVSKLKQIASATSLKKVRCHYEWLWDGARLWIVQADHERPQRTTPPGSLWAGKSKRVQIRGLNLLKRDTNKTIRNWPKIECVKIFRACGLPTAPLYILEDQKQLEDLSRRVGGSDLRTDLSNLLKRPIVIRTDVSKSVLDASYLLPRTDTLSTTDSALEFIERQTKYLIRSGISASDFCFLLHQFIPARASALCYAQPQNSRVRVDSIWGIPDGLLYYAHDSFELDALTGRTLKKRRRYKCDYIDVDEAGKWLPKQAGMPWDWKDSLSLTEVSTIADYTYKIACKVGGPVQVMFFVGVDPTSGHPSCLPWFIAKERVPLEVKAASISGLGTSRFKISDEKDVESYQNSLLTRGSPVKRIHLKPKPELLRSKPFLRKVAKLAIELRCPIELEGSILSHSFYLLQQEGASVRCIDPFEPTFKKQQFGKLVRDRVPVIIKSHGELAKTYRLTGQELIRLLKSKAVEEALELFWQKDADMEFDELADLYEVMDSILKLKGKSEKQLRTAARRKRDEKGSFEKGIVLVETQEMPLLRVKQQIPHTLQEELAIGDSSVSHEEDQTLTTKEQMRLLPTSKPRYKGNEILIPLVPPGRLQVQSPMIIRDKEMEAEVLIEYSEKFVSMKLRGLQEMYSNPKQLKLFD